MKVIRSGGGYLLRLMRGEEIHESLTAFARDQGLRGAAVRGIGAVEEVEVGYFHRDRKSYERRVLPGIHELLSLSGNLSGKDGEPFLHAHVVLMGADFTLSGGHLFRAVVAVTGEIAVVLADLDLVRTPDPDLGLALLEPGPGAPPGPGPRGR